MKILIISGFLGAGKTTYIKQMIKATNREYVIFENEFADINIDADNLRSEKIDGLSSDIEIMEFTNGCICCNMKGDFTASLLVIQNSLEPDFLIVEPSGVGVLSSIIKEIRKVEYEHIRLLEPITIADSKEILSGKFLDNEIFLDQIRVAKNIQLSKIENSTKEEIDLIESRIHELNPDARVFKTDYKNAGKEYWEEILYSDITPEERIAKEIKAQSFQNISHKGAKCKDIIELMKFLNRIVLGFYGKIYRAKGAFLTPDGTIWFDLVDGLYDIYGTEDGQSNDVIFIGEDIKRMKIKAELAGLASKGNSIKLR